MCNEVHSVLILFWRLFGNVFLKQKTLLKPVALSPNDSYWFRAYDQTSSEIYFQTRREKEHFNGVDFQKERRVNMFRVLIFIVSSLGGRGCPFSAPSHS